jgi:integrase
VRSGGGGDACLGDVADGDPVEGIDGGAELQVVRQCLGHSSLRTTERYLHTLPDADETALDAPAKIRSRANRD